MSPHHKHGHGLDKDNDSHPVINKIDRRRISGMAFELAKICMAAKGFEAQTSDKVADYCIDVATRIEKVRIDVDIDTDGDKD
jgi:HJR/Mrr/RecB family endonuclease